VGGPGPRSHRVQAARARKGRGCRGSENEREGREGGREREREREREKENEREEEREREAKVLEPQSMYGIY